MGRLRKPPPRLQQGQTVGSEHFGQIEVRTQVPLMIERLLAVRAGVNDSPA